GGGIHVVATDVDWSADLPDAAKRSERYHFAVGIANLEQADFAEVVAVLPASLDIHLPGAAELVEVVDVQGSEINLQCREHVEGIDSHRLALVALDVHKQLRHVGPEDTVESLDLVTAARALDEFRDLFLQLDDAEVATVLDDDFETAGRAESRYG